MPALSEPMSAATRKTLTQTLQKMMHHFVNESVAPQLTPEAPATASMLKALDLTDSIDMITPKFYALLPMETKKLLFSFLFEKTCAVGEGVENDADVDDAKKKSAEKARHVLDQLVVDAAIVAAEITKILPAAEALAATATIKETKRRRTAVAAETAAEDSKMFHRKVDKITDYVRASIKKIQKVELIVPPLQKVIEHCLSADNETAESGQR